MWSYYGTSWPLGYLLSTWSPGQPLVGRPCLWLSTSVQLKDRTRLGAPAPSLLEVAGLPC